MEAATVSRLMSLIPERAARSQNGSFFRGDGSARMDLLCRFLHWMGPLQALTREEQQLLGVRAGGGRSLMEGDDASESFELGDELEETPVRVPEAGTQIAA